MEWEINPDTTEFSSYVKPPWPRLVRSVGTSDAANGGGVGRLSATRTQVIGAAIVRDVAANGGGVGRLSATRTQVIGAAIVRDVAVPRPRSWTIVSDDDASQRAIGAWIAR